MTEALMSPQPVTLETEMPGLTLVQMTTVEDDAEYFAFQNANHDHIAEFGNTIDDSLEAVTARRTNHPGKMRFGIRLHGELIGMEGFTPTEDGDGAEVGILLAKEASGKGYSSPALKSISEYAALQFDRVFAEVDPNNIASMKLFERSDYHRTDKRAQGDWDDTGSAVVFEL